MWRRRLKQVAESAGDAAIDVPDGCGCLGDLHCLPLLIGIVALPPLLIWML